MTYTLINVPRFSELRRCVHCLLDNALIAHHQFKWTIFYECEYCHGIMASQFLSACIDGICAFAKPRKVIKSSKPAFAKSRIVIKSSKPVSGKNWSIE